MTTPTAPLSADLLALAKQCGASVNEYGVVFYFEELTAFAAALCGPTEGTGPVAKKKERSHIDADNDNNEAVQELQDRMYGAASRDAPAAAKPQRKLTAFEASLPLAVPGTGGQQSQSSEVQQSRAWIAVCQALQENWSGNVPLGGQEGVVRLIAMLCEEAKAFRAAGRPAAAPAPLRETVTEFNVGRYVLSEDDCIAQGIHFGAYERGVADAAAAFSKGGK